MMPETISILKKIAIGIVAIAMIIATVMGGMS